MSESGYNYVIYINKNALMSRYQLTCLLFWNGDVVIFGAM
jgi:hypothetical protein